MYHNVLSRKAWPNLGALFFLLSLCVLGYAFLNSVSAETWVCPRPGQADLYTDREYPGCQQLGEAKIYFPVTISPAPESSQGDNVSPSLANHVSSGVPQQQQSGKSVPFPEVSLSLPLLSVGQDKVGSITGSWTGFVAQLMVGYKADGKGPEILGDSNLLPVSAHSFHIAVAVATKAVGYDLRYLEGAHPGPSPVGWTQCGRDLCRGDRLGTARRSDSPRCLYVGNDRAGC